MISGNPFSNYGTKNPFAFRKPGTPAPKPTNSTPTQPKPNPFASGVGGKNPFPSHYGNLDVTA